MPERRSGNARCADCVHWDYERPRNDFRPILRPRYAPDTTDEEDTAREIELGEPYGECLAVEMVFDEEEMLPDPLLAFVQDGSRYMATLYTHRDFGCVMWGARDV